MSNVITSLTPAQQAKIKDYQEEFLRIGLSTETCNREEAEKALTECQLYFKLPKPKFVWVDSPKKGLKLAAQIAKGRIDVTKDEIKDQVNYMSYGSFEAYWGSFYCYIAEVLDVKKDELANITRRIMENCGCYWVFHGLIIISDKPKAIHMTDKKLHNPNGLALEYRDGYGICALNGEIYPSLMDMTIQKNLK